jgi:hypothetical protein
VENAAAVTGNRLCTADRGDTMTVRTRGRGARSSRDEGAAAVEFALVVVLLLTLAFGIIEFSLLLRDYVSVGSAVRVGARIASAEAGGGPATCPTTPTPPPPCTPTSAPKLAQDAADAIQREGTAMPKGNIDEIWVYKANASGLPGSATTLASATCSTNCVRYVWIDSVGRFQYASGSWASTSISACIGSSDAVGVLMKATHHFLTGMFGVTRSLSDRTVMQFEPLPTDSCQANKPLGSGGHA